MLFVTLLLLAAPIQDAPAAPAATTPRSDPNRITCINRVKTGSRTNFEQICHTRSEWALLRSENRKVVERGQQQQNLMDRDPVRAGN